MGRAEVRIGGMNPGGAGRSQSRRVAAGDCASGPGRAGLSGFLLSLPFTNRFAALSQGQRELNLARCPGRGRDGTAARTGRFDRLVFRRGEKQRLVWAANVMAVTGLAVVGLAVSAAILLATGKCPQRLLPC